MTMTEVRPAEASRLLTYRGENRRVYAIAFDMDTKALAKEWQRVCGNKSWRTAYPQIGEFLAGYGFSWKQGSLQFSSAEATPVTVVLAVQEMTKKFAWFAPSVRDIRMLRIEEDNDLAPAVNSVAPMTPHEPAEILDLFSALDADAD